MNRKLSSVVLLFGLTALSCGSDKNFDNFLGTYNTNGTITYSGAGCPAPVGTSGAGTITRGSSSDLLWQDPNCTIPANISGGTSFVVVQTTCTIHSGSVTSTLTINGNGTVSNKVMNTSLNGSVQVVGGGGTLVCTFTWAINGTKL